MADPEMIERNRNEDKMSRMVVDLNKRLSKIMEGGGKARQEKERERGKMTARERIAYLLDENKSQIEIGAFAGDGMYAEHGGCPSAGVIVVMGYIKGKQCLVVANDATVKAGAWFPITGKKNLRAQEIALENHLPIVYLVDSAGVYLPLQDEIFPDKEHFGRIFRNNAKLSAQGTVQIAAIMGSCVAGGAYLPIMSDESLIVDKTGTIFLAGSYLVKAAIGEDIDNETLGGASTHCEISGVTDYKAKDDADALDKIKSLISKIGEQKNTAGFDRTEATLPKREAKELYEILPEDRVKPYDVRHIIECLVDDSEYTEFKEDYGKTIVCAYARVDG
ncbi:MAG: acyl-CoA carboxylase subunit beta, partial [Bacteroidetes bacterium]|nr:acyl-CoA carboxylase subunit beta [Bacteroidota bacterium]